jgi:glucokinase
MTACALGVDLGGTKIKVALIDLSGAILNSREIPTNASEGFPSVKKRLISSILELIEHDSPKGVGIGIAGQIDPRNEEIIFAPNLNWRNLDLKSDLQKELNLPVSIIGDVKAATIGEWKFGAGKDSNDFVCLFFGTGIGAGIVIDGRLILGPNHTAGELGHTVIDLHGPKCSCGNWGCWEVYASGWAIAKKAREAVQNDPITGELLLEKCNGDLEKLSAKAVSEAAQEGDPLSQLIIADATEAIAIGCVSVINSLNPSRLIIGGGIYQGIPDLIVHIETAIQKRALAAAQTNLQVVPAQLGSDAGVIGAATLAF